MKFIVNRETILPPLLQIVNIIEKRQTMAILSNVLLKVGINELILTGSDLEIQLIATIPMVSSENWSITTPARKLLDICRLLPTDADITVALKKNQLSITSGRGRFLLSTLEAADYPEFSENKLTYQFKISAMQLNKGLNKTLFCMANNDVRFYLNGLMLNISNNKYKFVASNGHRLSIYDGEIEHPTGYEVRIIFPRKAVLELSRLLDGSDQTLQIEFSDSNIKVSFEQMTYSAKLVDAQYPDFGKVFNQEYLDTIVIDRLLFKDALTRVAVLSNDNGNGISLDFSQNLIKINAHNLEHEQAEEQLLIDFLCEQSFSIAFNAQYLLDAIANIDTETVHLSIAKNASASLIVDPNDNSFQFIVMPILL